MNTSNGFHLQSHDTKQSTPQTQQRLFFSICDHSSSSFAIENNWVRPHPPERSSKIGIWIEKFRCQNSNLNLPTIKNGFYGYSYLKDLLRILKLICAQFWNPWVIPVTWVCLDSATTQNSWRTSAQRTYLVFTFGRSLNFDLALYASRMSICALRTSLCGANAMCCWLMWVSASYRKL